MAFRYHWLHITSGKRGEGEAEASSRQDFLELLNDWNRLGAGNWQYWEA